MQSVIHLLLFGAIPFFLAAQPSGARSSLSLPQIMQGEHFVGYLPENIFWDLDSKHIYFSWNPDMDSLRSMYKVNIEAGSPEKMSYEDQRTLPRRWSFSRDRELALFEIQGDIFLQEMATGQRRRITNTIGRESGPEFSGDERMVLFERDNNLFAWNRFDGSVEQLTNFQRGREPSEKELPEYRQWLETQQMELFEVLRERDISSTLRERQSDSLDLERPLPIYLGDKRALNLQASPDMRFVTFVLYQQADEASTEVPYWVTESGYVENRNARAKVGSPQGTFELGIYDRDRDTSYRVETEGVPGIRDKPAFMAEYHEDSTAFEPEFEEDRKVSFQGPFFADDGKAAVVLRSEDNKDRWIMLLDPETGKLELLDHQHDDAWIGGPGISGWYGSAGTFGWLPGSRYLYFQSEATGYSHLYRIDVETGEKEALTSGDWEVRSVTLSPDKSHFYITANREGPDQHHVYRLPAGGGDLVRLTGEVGNHDATLSPDGEHFALRYSYSNIPWELYVQDTEEGSEPRRLTTSTTRAFNAYDWRDPEIVRFPASDGATVAARLYRPERPRRGGPAVIFVHGAGYLQNVHSWWSSYYREFMFHNFLADHGYTVLDIDYRGSDGYGRDWRTGIYRHMGGKDLSDQVDGARFLVEEYNIDPDRIGIYGGSYGGFITLMALFTAPETFAAGAALRSVTDWAHYNHGYTSNILNTPVEDPKAFERSSPINFAEGLAGQLLILHGMVDTNVQFQDVVRLAQRLIELGKENWEFAVFPVEGHGFVEASSWTDEYRRIFELFEETLK